VRRTQLYIEDDLWNALHARARSQGRTISELVRQAVRERYLGNLERRRDAMRAFIGIRAKRADLPDSVEYVRSLRRGGRLDKLESQ
jgi:hypothetical protein